MNFDDLFSEKEEDSSNRDDYYPTRELSEDSIFRRVGEDLTFRVKDKSPGDFSAREPEMRQLIRILGRRGKANPMVLGDAGVGKTFLVKCLAWKIVQREVPEWLLGRKVIRTSFYDVQAGVPGTYWEWGAYSKLLKELLEAASQEPVVLFIDEIHQMFGHPHSTNILKPYITDNRVRLIGATTTEEFHRFISRDEAVVRRFQEVHIAEPEGENLRQICMAELGELKRYYKVEVADDSDLVNYAVKLAEEYLPFRRQPDKTIDLLEQAFTNCRIDSRQECTAADLRAALAEMTGIPDETIAQEQERTRGLERALNARVLGQEEAIAAICSRLAVTRSRVQVNPERPLGVFLIAGPSGVGKTELAKALALHYTGSEDNLVRIDMSAHQTLESLLGRPGPPSPENPEFLAPLTLQMRRRPFCVLLLDEFEKAGYEVQLAFLQAFDYGKMEDLQGNVIYFSGAIVLMTCNVGFGDRGLKISGFGQGTQTDWTSTYREVMKAVEAEFPREFLGRVDEILVFKPLTPRVMDGFIAQKLSRLSAQLGKSISLSQEATEEIRKQGFSDKYGARPLNRAIDAVVGKALAQLKMTEEWEKARAIEVILKGGVPVAQVKG